MNLLSTVCPSLLTMTWCALALLLFPPCAYATEAPPATSLFLSPQETREAESQAEKSMPAGQGDIRLGAILYYAPHDWIIWLRGERWTPQTSRQDLSVRAVSADEVRLRWRGDGDKGAVIEKEITLTPNQTYQISTGKIIDRE